MLKDEQDRSYNSGVYAIPLKIWSDFSSIQYPRFQGEPTFSPLISVAGTNSVGASRTRRICVGEVKQYK